MKDWKLLTASEHIGGGDSHPNDNAVLKIRAVKGSFAIVLTRTRSGEYRAMQLIR
jgi:hypothetical protein